MTRKVIALLALVASLATNAFAGPPPTAKVNYATFSMASVQGGSIPTLRITLSANVAVNTNVALSSDNAALVLPAYVTVPAGTRTASVATIAYPVDATVATHATATLGASSASGVLTIVQPSILRGTFNPGGTMNYWDLCEFKVTLTGAAGPSGYDLNVYSDSYMSGVLPLTLHFDPGQRISRTSFHAPYADAYVWTGSTYVYTPTVYGSITLYHSLGDTVQSSYALNTLDI